MSASEPARGSDLRASLVVLGIALLLRLIGFREWIIAEDELYTLRDAFDLGANASGPGVSARPLYYLIQHILLQLLPPTALWIRLPALVFGLAGVWMTFLLGRRVFGTPAGTIAALLVAVSPWHIYSSQYARYWTLVYAAAAASLFLIARAIDGDDARHWLAAAVAISIGTVTHPTYVFPMVGAVLALHLVTRDGKFAWQWPSRHAVLFGWGPAVLIAGAVLVAVRLLAPVGIYGNGAGRGIATTLRIIPGMAQWLGVEVAFVAAFGAVAMLFTARDRRWGAAAVLGCGSTLVLLLVSGIGNDVYADYGMAMLPLVFVTAAGVVVRLGAMAGSSRPAVVIGATAVLVVSALPGTVSHLSDGTRFDYRPALARVAASAEARPLLGWPLIQSRHYAPGLEIREFEGTAAQLKGMNLEEGFWVIGSFARYGLFPEDGTARPWLDMHCRVELRTERPRVDYRVYRTELFWCSGGAPAPARLSRTDSVR